MVQKVGKLGGMQDGLESRSWTKKESWIFFSLNDVWDGAGKQG